jgi:hypothetical protein
MAEYWTRSAGFIVVDGSENRRLEQRRRHERFVKDDPQLYAATAGIPREVRRRRTPDVSGLLLWTPWNRCVNLSRLRGGSGIPSRDY